MKTILFAGLISSVVLACLWLKWSAGGTAACSKKKIITPVAAKKIKTYKETIAFLRLRRGTYRLGPKEQVEIAVLQLNLSLDRDMPKK